MKLQSICNARSIWWGHLNDINPRGINLFPIVAPLLVSTYKFIQFPSIQDVANPTDGLKFQTGEFANNGEHPARISFTIYDECLIANSSSSTDHADAFLRDVLKRLDEIFNLSNSEQVINRKNYLNELYVYTNKSLDLLSPQLKIISEYLSNNVVQDVRFELGGISFFPDQINKNNPPVFRFERAVNVPFSENRYYSIAPLQTSKHLELLENLEAIMKV